MDDRVLITTPDLLAAIALAMQAFAIEIEMNGGPNREQLAHRLAGITEGAQTGVGYAISMIASVVGNKPSGPPDLRLV
jgi:hypothetical protein